MTVKELRDLLGQCPPEAKVRLRPTSKDTPRPCENILLADGCATLSATKAAVKTTKTRRR